MKTILILCVSVVCVGAGEYYVISPDDFTPDTLRENLEEIKQRLDCITDHGPCTALGNEYKKIGTEIIANKCTRCSPEFKDLIRVFLDVSRVVYPDEYSKLRHKYDPSGEHFDEFEEAVGCQKNYSVLRRP